MSGNNGKGDTPLRDMWITPSWIFDPLKEQYRFTTDCCASKENTKCEHYYTREKPFEDFSQDIIDIAWMNPPYSIAWKMFEHFFKYIKSGVAIYRADNFETGIWQKVIFPKATWVFIPNKRVSYEGLDGDGARFPSALIGFNVAPPKGLKGISLQIMKQ